MFREGHGRDKVDEISTDVCLIYSVRLSACSSNEPPFSTSSDDVYRHPNENLFVFGLINN